MKRWSSTATLFFVQIQNNGGILIVSLSIEIQKKQKGLEEKQVLTAREVFELEEVQEIKDAVQEHLLFIGLDNRNNIKNISLLGIGTSEAVRMNTKYIIRTALMTTSDRVILVHNHPSNGLEPSDLDKHITNYTSKLLEIYNIKLLDHIIVTEDNYVSMNSINAIDRKYEDDKTKTIDKVLLIEENEKLKEKIKILTDKLQTYENQVQEEEDEFE